MTTPSRLWRRLVRDVRDARIGWNEGGLIRHARRLDALDRGWLGRRSTLRLLCGCPPMQVCDFCQRVAQNPPSGADRG